jgi:hypothetical protein
LGICYATALEKGRANVARPGSWETAVERAKCQIEALGIMRMVTSPVGLPLLEQYFKVRMFVAEQIQAGKMTFEQGNKIITEKRGQVIAEENRILREQRQAIYGRSGSRVLS